ncbi:MAG: hypothetical protein QW812_01220 [Thermoplasmataceae archaeon]
MEINCVVIEGKRISGYANPKDLLTIGGDQILVVDKDAIYHNRLNFKLYGEVSKFFEVVVMNFSRNLNDLIDSLVSGCQRVVISPHSGTSDLQRFLEITDQIIMPASGDLEAFRGLGGKYGISDGLMPGSFELVYNTGLPLKGDVYCNIKGFPDEINRFLRR